MTMVQWCMEEYTTLYSFVLIVQVDSTRQRHSRRLVCIVLGCTDKVWAHSELKQGGKGTWAPLSAFAGESEVRSRGLVTQLGFSEDQECLGSHIVTVVAEKCVTRISATTRLGRIAEAIYQNCWSNL